jgi:hypothetical protein
MSTAPDPGEERSLAVSPMSRRAWLVDHLPHLVTEGVYHRSHHHEMQDQPWVVWHWDEDEGAVALVAPEGSDEVEQQVPPS